MKHPRLLITGCGRSGTAFAAKVLGSGGDGSVAHEGVFTPGTKGDWPLSHPVRVEVSWMAVPYLDSMEDVYVVHQVRDPLLVVRSFVGFRFFSRPRANPYLNYLIRHEPSCASWSDPIDQAVQYWIRWNQRTATRADRTVRLEDIDGSVFSELAAIAGLPDVDYGTHAASLGKRYNGRRRALGLNMSDLLNRPLGSELSDVAGSLGYDLKS